MTKAPAPKAAAGSRPQQGSADGNSPFLTPRDLAPLGQKPGCALGERHGPGSEMITFAVAGKRVHRI
jgi:hypothetical protein